jgi:hypothetical protein
MGTNKTFTDNKLAYIPIQTQVPNTPLFLSTYVTEQIIALDIII